MSSKPQQSKPQQHYEVWVIQSRMGMQDPDMPPGRLHHAIFVQTRGDDGDEHEGSGEVHHVIGDVTSPGGMVYNSRPSPPPESSESFVAKRRLGRAPASSYPAAWLAVLSALPTPPQQKAFNPATRRTEPFKERLGEGGRAFVFYEPGEERRPLWKCTEWTEQHAIPALVDRGLILTEEPPVAGQN